MDIVANSRAVHRGFCQHCDRRIDRAEPIFKIDIGDRGRQTAGGNGKGEWWCEACALELQRQLTLDV